MGDHDVLGLDHGYGAVAPRDEVGRHPERPGPPVVTHHSTAPDRIPASVECSPGRGLEGESQAAGAPADSRLEA